ncbi:MAG: four helix bundle protein [Bacteroidales bacterium]|nr:four helix bundle protein [Bacteroidales bacterium]
MESPLYKDAYAFSIRCMKAYDYLTEQKHEFEVSRQLKRSGTSISANISEAHYAQSKADWINKMSIALKEANESKYWINLLHDSDLIDDKVYQSIMNDCVSLIVRLSNSVKTAKRSLK